MSNYPNLRKMTRRKKCSSEAPKLREYEIYRSSQICLTEFIDIYMANYEDGWNAVWKMYRSRCAPCGHPYYGKVHFTTIQAFASKLRSKGVNLPYIPKKSRASKEYKKARKHFRKNYGGGQC